MATFFLAKVRPQNYEALRRVLQQHVPDTYDKWEYLQAKRMADVQGSGDIAQEVEIDPDEFARHCDATGVTRNMESLDQFVYEKGRRQQD